MSLSLLVVASASEETVTLNTSYTVQGSLLTCTFTLDTGDTKGVGALSFYVKTTGLTFKPWNTEANKPIVQYGDMLPPTFKPGKAGVTDGYYSFTNGNGKDSRGYFIAAGGDPREGDSQRLLKGSSVLIFKATYTIDSSDYTLATEDFKACLDGEQAKLEETRYTCVAPASVDKTPAATYSVSGAITSYNAANDATVQLKKNNDVVKSITVSKGVGNFTITDVPAGTYDLVVTKSAHLTYTITGITVGSEDIDLTAKTDKPYQTITLLCGDLNGDGMINPSDINVIYEPANYYKNATDDNRIADLNGDGMINPSDINIIYEAANYYKTTANCTFDF